MSSERRPTAVGIPIDMDRLFPRDRYRFGGAISAADRLPALARALATTPVWSLDDEATIVVRTAAPAAIGVIGQLDDAAIARFGALSTYLEEGLPRLRPVNFAGVEADCERLATGLIERFGRDEVRGMDLVAIPRGGLIVAGILAYMLEIPRSRIFSSTDAAALFGGEDGRGGENSREGESESEERTGEREERGSSRQANGRPVLVVDDCAISGARFREVLGELGGRRVVFAHLYSHPDLRTAIEAHEPRVAAVMGARDLRDFARELHGDEYDDWRERWSARSPQSYWIGQPERVCFPWSEPDAGLWNPVLEREETAWRLVPPEVCLKNRFASRNSAAPDVYVQPEGKGPLRPGARTLFADRGDDVVIASLDSGDMVRLTGLSADVWRGVIDHGSIEEAVRRLLREYDVVEGVLKEDATGVVEDLTRRGLLADGASDERKLASRG